MSPLKEQIKDLIKTHSDGQNLTAAYIGNQAKQKGIVFPGDESLKDVLTELEKDEFLRIVSTEKNALAVELNEQSSHSVEGPATIDSGVQGRFETGFSYLKEPVWKAFVYRNPRGPRYINKETGTVKFSDGENPVGADWVEIDQITEDEEIAWSKLFVDGKVDVPTENWPGEFLERLRQHPQLHKDWNRKRSRTVFDRAKIWAENNEVAFELLLPKAEKRGRLSERKLDESAQKALILKAVSGMELEELLELKIAAKHFIAAMQLR